MLYDRVRRGHPDTRELKKAADALWEDPGIINEFIEAVEEQADIDEDDRRILEGWCHPLTGFFSWSVTCRAALFLLTQKLIPPVKPFPAAPTRSA